MKFTEFAERINTKWTEKFNGKCSVKIDRRFSTSIYIRFRMRDEIDVTVLNDMLQAVFNIDLPKGFTAEDEMPEFLTMENLQSHFYTKPENQYYAYGSKKIPYRKAKGTPEKIIESLEKYIDRLYGLLVEARDADNIHETHIKILAANLK